MNTAWAQTTLGEIADIVSGATPSTSVKDYWDGDIRWVTPKDLSDLDGSEISDTARSISNAGLRSCAASVLPANSVLLSSRAPIGLVAINKVPMATNQGFKSLVPDHRRVDSRFLYWWLRKNRPLLESLGNGATFKEISKKSTSAVAIELPPIEEQRRIAAVLDAADALRAKRRQALATLDTLTQAIFIDMFGGGRGAAVSPNGTPSGHPNGWKWRPILELAELATGHTPDRKRPDYWDGEMSWVNLNEIREFDGGVCHATAARITPEGVRHSSAVVLPAGTVCFSRTASIGFVTIMGVPMTTSQDFVNWICGEQLNPTYLMHALLMSREVLRASSSGSTHKTIYVRDAERFAVLHPPRQLQDEFEQLILRVRASSALMSADLVHLDALFASLQQRAFRGDL